MKKVIFLAALVMVWGMAAFAGPFIQFDYDIAPADPSANPSAEFTGGVEFQLETTLSWITVEATIAASTPEDMVLITSATYEYKGQLAEFAVTGAMEFNPIVDWTDSRVLTEELTLDAEITIPVGKALIYGNTGFTWLPIDNFIGVKITGSAGFRIEW